MSNGAAVQLNARGADFLKAVENKYQEAKASDVWNMPNVGGVSYTLTATTPSTSLYASSLK